jgi:hypothetical protein|tara:strand:+ start:408 stop:686 length:279 start_codon:yes stop_codon:yes gene_type:complete
VRFYLVNKLDEIVDKVDIGDVGLNGARTYFIGRKQIDAKEFDKLWKVMTREQYDTNFKNNLQNRQMGKMKYEWWKEDKAETDEVLKGKDGLG